jgi:hypothetical protein
MLLNSADTHRPGEPEKPDSMQNCPSVRFEFTVNGGDLMERTFFCFAGNYGERMTSSLFTQDRIEDKNPHAI